MANSARWRFGNRNLRKYAVESTTVIYRGDMLYVSGGYVYPAGDFTWDTNIGTTQGAFAAAFVGIAAEDSPDGEDDDIDVDTSHDSVYEMDCASATLAVGTPVGPAKQTGDLLEPQKVVSAAAAASIGRVHTAIASSTLVKVQFASIHEPGSNNVNGALG